MNPIIIGNATLYRGDCLDVLRTLPDNSVDSIITDPPYGLTANKKGGSGVASVNLDSPYGRARIGTGNGPGGFMGLNWDSSVPSVAVWAECLRVLKPGGHLLAFAGTRTQHRMAVNIEDAGFEIRDMIAWVYGSGFPKSHNGEWGGTALKPALEPITVARKPLAGTVAENWREHGTGALNIDGCRVGWPDGKSPEIGTPGWGGPAKKLTVVPGQEGETVDRSEPHKAGRWPANLIHDGSDEVVSLFPHTKSGVMKAGTQRAAQDGPRSVCYGTYGGNATASDTFGDEGSAARFFYCAKASRKDRNEGLPSGSEKAVGTGATMREAEDADWSKRNGNFHPTVKPTDLMRYLCRLVTPRGGTVLDPFMGSGSTGKAAMLEGFRFIGVERDEDENGNHIGYMDIAAERIRHVQKQERNESAQMSIFGEVESCLA